MKKIKAISVVLAWFLLEFIIVLLFITGFEFTYNEYFLKNADSLLSALLYIIGITIVFYLIFMVILDKLTIMCKKRVKNILTK